MAGGWKLTEVQVDGELFTENYSDYRLILSDPSPSAEGTSQFQRVNIGGDARDRGDVARGRRRLPSAEVDEHRLLARALADDPDRLGRERPVDDPALVQ